MYGMIYDLQVKVILDSFKVLQKVIFLGKTYCEFKKRGRIVCVFIMYCLFFLICSICIVSKLQKPL